MNTICRTMIGGVGALALLALGGGAYAQAPSSEAMKSGSMASEKPKMSHADTETMKKCKAMSADARAADTSCKALMAAHPDMMSGKKAAEKPK